MPDRPPLPFRRRDSATPASAPPVPGDARFLDALAAGAYDQALAQLASGHLVDDAESALWDDPRFLDWWAAQQRVTAATGSALTDASSDSDLGYLADGIALRARVRARQLGVRRYDAAPTLRPAPVVAPPAESLERAAGARATPFIDLAVAAGAGRALWDEPVDTWVVLPTDVPDGRYLALRVAGDSMTPAISPGDTVLVALGRPPRAGAAVVAQHPDDGYVCKRVRRVRRTTLELESLAPGRPLITLPRRDDLVLGVVIGAWR